MHKSRVEENEKKGRLRLPSRPVRVSKEELAASRAGTLGCFPSPDLYEPEDDSAEEQPAPPGSERRRVAHAGGRN